MKKKLLKTLLVVALGGAAEYVVTERPDTLEEQGKIALAGAAVAGAAWWAKRPKQNFKGVAKVLGAVGGGAALAVVASPSADPSSLVATAIMGAVIGATGLAYQGPRDEVKKEEKEQVDGNSEVHGNPPVRQSDGSDPSD